MVTNSEDINYDEEIFQSELAYGFRNFALINMIKVMEKYSKFY